MKMKVIFAAICLLVSTSWYASGQLSHLTPTERAAIEKRVEESWENALAESKKTMTPEQWQNVVRVMNSPEGKKKIAEDLARQKKEMLEVYEKAHIEEETKQKKKHYETTERYNARKEKERAEENKLRAERIDPSWTVIERISGSNNYRSQNYKVDYDEFAVVWRTEPGSNGDTNFAVWIEQDSGARVLVANTIGAGGSKYFHKGPAEFRLNIQTSQNFVITIQGRDSK